MAAKRKQAVRSRSGRPAWFWLGIGVLLGGALAAVVFVGGWAPTLRDAHGPRANPDAPVNAPSEPGIADSAPAPREYDFYSVLPEMEVVIPDAELSASARRESRSGEADAAPAAAGAGKFVLQAGSFQSSGDAEAEKARLALMGFVANVQSVTINGTTWNRVRLGPYASAAQVEDAKRKLEAAGVHAIALKEQ